jgi:hypothetical protein
VLLVAERILLLLFEMLKSREDLQIFVEKEKNV